MKPITSPPRWLEQTLLLLLPARSRDSIAGDLHEFHAERVARYGRVAANTWYARQVLSLVPQRFTPPERFLAALASFAALYGAWFGVMELLLRHTGYGAREWIAGTILAQAVLTLTFLLLPGAVTLRYLVALGCLPLLFLVSLVVRAVIHASDLEGYVILMALTLAVQIALTATVLARRIRHSRPVELG